MLGERDPLTQEVIGAAIEVHREMGPGLLESQLHGPPATVYRLCRFSKMCSLDIPAERSLTSSSKFPVLSLMCLHRFLNFRPSVATSCPRFYLAFSSISKVEASQLLWASSAKPVSS